MPRDYLLLSIAVLVCVAPGCAEDLTPGRTPTDAQLQALVQVGASHTLRKERFLAYERTRRERAGLSRDAKLDWSWTELKVELARADGELHVRFLNPAESNATGDPSTYVISADGSFQELDWRGEQVPQLP